MKSIYSVEVLQRIVDHWGIGPIEDVTYFANVGRGIWRHRIETSQGSFELYSYIHSDAEYAQQKVRVFLGHDQTRPVVHSFDRHHILFQFTKKQRISVKQAVTDLNILVGASIQKAFRVYGTIFQIHLRQADVNQADVLVSYGWWSMQENTKGRANVVVDSRMHGHDQLDEAISCLENEKPSIQSYALKGSWFELKLSNGMSLHFVRSRRFPAIEIHLKSRRNDLLIFEENELYYVRDLRE